MIAQATPPTRAVEFYVRPIVFESLLDNMFINGWQFAVGVVIEYQRVPISINKNISIDFERGRGVFNFELKLTIL